MVEWFIDVQIGHATSPRSARPVTSTRRPVALLPMFDFVATGAVSERGQEVSALAAESPDGLLADRRAIGGALGAPLSPLRTGTHRGPQDLGRPTSPPGDRHRRRMTVPRLL